MAVPGEARLPPGRLRLHDLHRQLGPAARRGLARSSTSTTSRWSSVLSGNRNFEGRINPDVQDELPRLAAAGGRLRAGRHDGLRLRPPSRSARPGRRRRCSCGTSGPPPQEVAGRRSRASINRDMFTSDYADVFNGDERWRASTRRRATRSRGTQTRPTSASPRTSTGMTMEPPAGHRHHWRPGARQARRLGHHRPHLARRLDQAGQPGRPVPGRARGRPARTSTPTARAAATTR